MRFSKNLAESMGDNLLTVLADFPIPKKTVIVENSAETHNIPIFKCNLLSLSTVVSEMMSNATKLMPVPNTKPILIP